MPLGGTIVRLSDKYERSMNTKVDSSGSRGSIQTAVTTRTNDVRIRSDGLFERAFSVGYCVDAEGDTRANFLKQVQVAQEELRLGLVSMVADQYGCVAMPKAIGRAEKELEE